MKKYIILIIAMFIGMTSTFAATTISTNKDKIEVGDSFVIYVKMTSSAAWNIHTSATGPVSNCIINQADASSDANNVNKTFSTTCKSTGEGTITINLSGDTTTADGKTTNLSGSATVTVVKKGTLPKTTPTTNSKSTNNKLKGLTIVGYTPNKVNDNNYTLTVDNTVNSITISATAEDDKATIKGTGTHNLVVGDNNISITIISESGAQNVINIRVTRKEQATLDDLNKLLNSSNSNIEISINNVNTINENVLKSIKDSGKTINLKYYDDNRNNTYTWILDGKKIDNLVGFNPIITFTSNDVKDLMKDSNYALGKVVNFAHSGKLPSNTIIKIFVGDRIDNNTRVNVYEFKDNNFDLVKENLLVENGYVEFSLEHCSVYFVSPANINNSTCEKTEPVNNSIILIIVSLILAILVLFNIWYFFFRKNNNHNNYNY